MKKVLSFFCFFVIGCCISQNAKAISAPDFTPLLPMSLQFCGQCTPSAISEVTTSLEMVKKLEDEYKKLKNVQDVVRKLENYALSVGKTMFNSLNLEKRAREKVISYSRTIEQCQIADMDDAESVKEAFIKLFLQYPSIEPQVMAKYHDKLEQFKEDTAVEMYITATEMDKELQVMIGQLNNIENCLILGQDCSQEGLEEYNCQSEQTEDKVCLWRNALTAVRIYDRLMRYNEYLIAMRAQMEAVNSLDARVKPREKKPDQQSSNNLTESKKFAMAEINSSSAYAAFEFDEIKTAGVVSSLKGKEKDFEGLKIFAQGENAWEDAKKIHNLKQQMPHMRDTFVTYNKVKKYYQKTIDDLLKSHQCAILFLDEVYNDSEQVWIGQCKLNGRLFSCPYSPQKDLEDKSESFGEYDVSCNGGREKCYVLEMGDFEKVGGASGWITGMYKEINDDTNPTAERFNNAAVDAGGKSLLHMSSSDGDLPDNGGSLLTPLNTMNTVSDGQDDDKSDGMELKLQLQNGEVLEDLIKKEDRAADLLAWSLGADFNSIINDEISGELTSASGDKGKITDKRDALIGSPKKRFPLWVDQKNFYNQYVDNKYANIKDYIQNEPMYEVLVRVGLDINKTYPYKDDVDTEGNITKSKEKKRSEMREKLEALLNGLLLSNEETLVEKIASQIEQEKGRLEGVTTKYEQLRMQLEGERKSYFQQLERVSILLDQAREELSIANDEIETADQSVPINALGEEYVEKQKDSAKQNSNNQQEEKFVRHKLAVEDYPQYKEYNKTRKDQEKIKKDAEIRKEGLLEKIAAYERQRKTIREQIEQTEKEINRTIQKYVREYYNTQNDTDASIEALKESPLTSAELDVAAALSTNPILILANEKMQKVRDSAEQKVEEIEGVINSLKISEELYYFTGYTELKNLHKNFIESLTGGGDTVQALMFGDLNSGDEDGDIDYFVGIHAQKKDFATPKSPLEFSYGPLREVFHFDTEDYASIDMAFDEGTGDDGVPPEDNEKVLLVGELFVDSYLKIVDDYQGVSESYKEIRSTKKDNENFVDEEEMTTYIEFPQIWKYVLKNRPFVEKKIDLAEFLNSGGNEGETFLRAGIYPCHVDGSIVDVATIEGYPWAGYTTDASSSQRECQNLKSERGIKDVEAGQKVGLVAASNKDLIGASELGQILDYVEVTTVKQQGVLPIISKEGRLTFRKELQHAVYVISTSEDVGEDGHDDTPYYLYKRAMLDTNIFGDFLDNVSVVNTAKDTLDNVASQIYGDGDTDSMVIVNEICNTIEDIEDENGQVVVKSCAIDQETDPVTGLDIITNHRNEFDLTDDKLYKDLQKLFEDEKLKFINKAKEKLEEARKLKVVTDSVKSKLEDLENKIKLLEQDKDELVAISGNETIDELDEKIKNAKADNAVEDEYQKKRNNVMDEAIEKLRAPYCPSYSMYYDN